MSDVKKGKLYCPFCERLVEYDASMSLDDLQRIGELEGALDASQARAVDLEGALDDAMRQVRDLLAWRERAFHVLRECGLQAREIIALVDWDEPLEPGVSPPVDERERATLDASRKAIAEALEGSESDSGSGK